jgi:RNA polymerase sigma factor (sigma-70 family)
VEGPWFDTFVHEHGARLRRALVAANGVQIGNDACADALAWAWEQRDRVIAMEYPVAYLYRVGQSSARRQRRWLSVDLPPEARPDSTPDSSWRLEEALGRLNRKQRTVVLLVHAHGWSYAEVAEAVGLSVAAVRNHVHRGLQRLRRDMEGS